MRYGTGKYRVRFSAFIIKVMEYSDYWNATEYYVFKLYAPWGKRHMFLVIKIWPTGKQVIRPMNWDKQLAYMEPLVEAGVYTRNSCDKT